MRWYKNVASREFIRIIIIVVTLFIASLKYSCTCFVCSKLFVSVNWSLIYLRAARSRYEEYCNVTHGLARLSCATLLLHAKIDSLCGSRVVSRPITQQPVGLAPTVEYLSIVLNDAMAAPGPAGV